MFAPEVSTARASIRSVILADEMTHRALAYIAAGTRGGGTLSAEDLEAYMHAPDRLKPRYQNLFTASVAETIASVADAFGTGSQISPGETWRDYLVRVRWAAGDVDAIRLTDLGRRILQELERPTVDLDDDNPIAVIIHPEDPFAYIRVFELIASQGGGMFVDPYIGTKELMDILSIPSVKQILTGSRKIKEHTLMAKALGIVAEPPEVRWVPQAELHDRFFIPSSGDLLAFGSSLNTIAKRPGVVIPFGDPTLTAATRAAYAALWKKGTHLAPSTGGSEPGQP